MFFISWGSKWEYKRKEDGLAVSKLCPNCHRYGDFFEVVPTKYFTLFWMPIAPTETKNSLLECSECQERFYIQQSDYAAAPASRKKTNVIEMPSPEIKKPNSPTKEINFIFECENCEKKLRVPKSDSVYIVSCPNCKNSFKVKSGRRI